VGASADGNRTSITAGAVHTLDSASSRVPAWIVGGIVLAMFVPVHISIWDRFPSGIT